MPRREPPDRTGRGPRRRRWSSGARVRYDPGPPRFFSPTGAEGRAGHAAGHPWLAGAALDDAAMEELHAVAEELRIGGHVGMDRGELVQHIRDRL